MKASRKRLVVRGDLRLVECDRLPRNATAVVEIVDVTLPDLPILLSRREMEKLSCGPMQFRIEVKQDVLVDGNIYVLGGRVLSGSKTVWFSHQAQRLELMDQRYSVQLGHVIREKRERNVLIEQSSVLTFTPSYRLLGARSFHQEVIENQVVY